ncbi:MAG: hypothetical protein ACT4PZ_23925, partial [Panacagrimonas sp.]
SLRLVSSFPIICVSMIDRTYLRSARAVLITSLVRAAMIVLLPEEPIQAGQAEQSQIHASAAPSAP